ncbi:large subunit ribosomal protein L3 [Breznakia sp. PF5-3]|uniref:50S ribosomal protein L3 n=1 Tax=unclassified Breznakia TaxID=2623764 RepID=UPI0024068B8C|nr:MULTISPECIES: 50S ribosomal protein L3 [unclassified Breznakia]MDL2276906.1 50S ribosomal protein L3 [Breznakia sp. OttesenSCG-928-G09]MDF9825171.1 large subunit ribosomal protein L3 [Breznakia sp. PM6-1]MDF9835970.1 large subunit ribosomal protein L3 [Breznakia sp. PF5-3]MDF9838068.1 large subunit ribosomal protein L3 [Breznakia sp. PFB2-8]MDF9860102.1 large subunit ribosomal protein L3 [Breznakia sp. PH5-24]
MKGILGRKIGMTQVFTEDGVLIPVTVVEATPNIVLQKKTVENDGYEAVQLGFEDVKERRATKASKGHAAKVNTAPKKFAREIRGNGMTDLELGAEVKVDIFEAGDIVDVTGTSKGKGFMGTVVRNNASIGPKSHGSGHHRHIGSLATGGITSRKGKIDKGTVMAGQEGGYKTTNQNLEIIKVDANENYLLIKGNVPGPKKGLVIVKSAVKKTKKDAEILVSYEDEVVEEVVEEVVATEAEPVVEEVASETSDAKEE